MASSQALPEPMNSSPHHPKVKLTTTLADPTFVAGKHVSGKLEMECRADRGLGIGIMMVELFAIQELTSRDHSATSTFIHSRRLFQGPGLPPSNAVQAHPMPGDPPLPQHYYQARRGRSTFLFRIPIPASSPSSITFSSGLAKVRYELRASVGVFWKNEKRLVVDKHSVDVVEAYPDDACLGRIPEAVVVGESGKLWMQGRLTSGVVTAGGSACLELQVKNHSSKKNTGLTLAVTRTLYLPAGTQRQAPVLISDTLTTVPFRGPEYIVPPGAEGVANLVFDVPKYARGVRGGTLDGEESEGGPRHSESLFEIRCKVEVKFTLGMGSKDLLLEMPIDIVHPKALPPPQDLPGPYGQPYSVAEPVYDYNPYYHPPTSPAPLQLPYIDPIQNQVWLPPPPIPIQGHPYYQPTPQPYYAAQDPTLFVPANGAPHIPRPLSAGPVASASQMLLPVVPGLPDPYAPAPLLPLHDLAHPPEPMAQSHEAEEGKGERALRVTQHLRMSSRTRSVSPQSHRYPLPVPPQTMLENAAAAPISIPLQRQGRRLPAPPPLLLRQDNLSTSPPGGSDGVVHSPRPQLTPKHSFTRDPVLGATVKSERVEELEKMADVVARKSQDLSNDVPKGIMATLEAAAAEEKATEEANVNKTLPGPPVPSGKQKDLLALPSRARADLFFAADKQEPPMKETSPLPSDQTPPTPALVAVPSRRNELLKTESGLDALERRLLAEVGTRNFDSRHHAPRDQPHPDVRSVLPIDTALEAPSRPIPIPVKSPEPLNDSAISSLTLAGGLGGGDDSDGEFDGRTHRAGRSRNGGSGDEGEVGLFVGSAGRSPDAGSMGLHMHMHMRERAEGSTPTKTSKKEREKTKSDAEGKSDKEKEKKEGKTSGKKKDRSSTKFAGKGRVAAWLGGIDPDVPPQEQIIPPSPSVVRGPNFTLLDDDPEEDNFPSPVPLITPVERQPVPEAEADPSKDVSAPPNPRSSGFVPIARLKRDTIRGRPLVTRDATVVEEARKVQNLWSDASVAGSASAPPGLPSPRQDEHTTPKIPAQTPGYALKSPFVIAPTARPQSIRTDRRVSPPSARPNPIPGSTTNLRLYANVILNSSAANADPNPHSHSDKYSQPNTSPNPNPSPADPSSSSKPSTGTSRPVLPLSYSAAAKAVWKAPPPLPAKDHALSAYPPASASTPAAQASSLSVQNKPHPQAKLPSFPPLDPEVKYDIRSARGGRGGKVTSVANLWASGAIPGLVGSNGNANGVGRVEFGRVKDGGGVQGKRLSAVEEGKVPSASASASASAGKSANAAVATAKPKPPPPPAAPKPEKKLFSAAVMTPPPARSVPPPFASSATKPAAPPPVAPKPQQHNPEAQKRPDSRNLFSAPSPPSSSSAAVAAASKPAPPPPPGVKRVPSMTRLQPTTNGLYPSSKPPSRSTSGKITPTDGVGKPSSKPPLLTPNVKPPIAALNLRFKAGDPAVVSSSHAVPTLSSTASLARPNPRPTSGLGLPKPKLSVPPLVASTSLGGVAKASGDARVDGGGKVVGKAVLGPGLGKVEEHKEVQGERPPSPSKPNNDLAFGQARLRDLIRKYQGVNGPPQRA